MYSFAQNFADCGQFGVYVGSLPSKIDDVISVVKGTISDVVANGITEGELARGKGQLRGGLVLGLEDSGARMTRIAKAELVTGELPSINEALERISAVTLDDIASVAVELFSQPATLAVVGPFKNARRFDAQI